MGLSILIQVRNLQDFCVAKVCSRPKLAIHTYIHTFSGSVPGHSCPSSPSYALSCFGDFYRTPVFFCSPRTSEAFSHATEAVGHACIACKNCLTAALPIASLSTLSAARAAPAVARCQKRNTIHANVGSAKFARALRKGSNFRVRQRTIKTRAS